MRIAAVIPNWNGAALLRALLPTVQRQTRRFDLILVVDNGSTDDSVPVAEAFGARVLRFEANRGFAAAINAGAAEAQADVLAILNNDVELESTWLERGEKSLADGSVAFVAGKIVSFGDASIMDGAFDAICRGGCALRCGAGVPDSAFWARPRAIQLAPMTALLVRSNVFLGLGGLDEAFGSYLEDVEFGLRCASYGYTGVYEPSMMARHRGSATLGAWSARTVRHISTNQVLLLARHYDASALWRFGWQIALAQVLWGAMAMLHGQVAAWAVGKIEGLRLFRSYRRTGTLRLPEILEESERVIAEVQQQTGWDRYWRLYFALTPRLPDR
ncbi:MAG TPA: glycosyltransferase family 2 protein [Bryobacteraceae bacterium]|nr:glycosyltransferase family 2 protein [Bryobacteraceae bacterium]